jgi:hypothetical protein
VAGLYHYNFKYPKNSLVHILDFSTRKLAKRKTLHRYEKKNIGKTLERDKRSNDNRD